MRDRSPVPEKEKINGFGREITCWTQWVWQHPAKCSISLEKQLQAQQSQGKAWDSETTVKQVSELLPRGAPGQDRALAATCDGSWLGVVG